MALEIIGGAALGAAVAELLRAVIDGKDKANNFRPVLTRLESTLKSITPRVNAINLLNNKLNLPDEQMKELITLLQNGLELVLKCSKLSTINLVKKIQYSKELLHLDYSLLRYFQTVLPLDLFRNDMEMLVIMRELHMKIVGDDKKDGDICQGHELCTKEGLKCQVPSSFYLLGTGSPRGMFGEDIFPSLRVEDGEGLGNVIRRGTVVKRTIMCSLEDLYKGTTKKIWLPRDVTDASGRPTTVEELLTIEIKPGWKKGTKIIFSEKGSELQGVIPSDIVYIIDEKPHSVFRRDGNDLVVTQKISLGEDLLVGNMAQLTTLDGRNLTILINAIISSTFEVVVEGEGMPIVKEPSKKGNLRIMFNIKNLPYSCTALQEDSIDDKKDEGICHGSELSKAHQVSDSGVQEAKKLYQESNKVIAVNSFKNSKNKKYQIDVRIKPLGHMYHNKSRKNLFLLKGCPYNLDVEDLRRPDCKFVGMGSFGTSYRCMTKYGVFLIKNFMGVNVKESKFIHHLEKLAIVGQHPNVILPFGFHFSEYDKFLLYDYVPGGSLYARLHDYRITGLTPLDWDSRVKIALGTARGISHLHYEGEGGVKFIHGNIKSSNVLLTPDLDGCISDYGLVPIMKYSATKNQNSGYHAPELNKHTKVTQESDVYSFGTLLLEILTEQRPDSVIFPKWVRYMVLKKGICVVETKLFQFGNCNEGMMQMLGIAMECLEKEPNRRPKMDNVVRMIENIQPSR